MKIETVSPMYPSHSFPLFFSGFFKKQELLGNSMTGGKCGDGILAGYQKEGSRYQVEESWMSHF